MAIVGNAANVMVWFALFTVRVKFSATGLKLSSPACLVEMIQLPAAKILILLPTTIATEELLLTMVTGNPELAVIL
jgi:hypothetical protein